MSELGSASGSWPRFTKIQQQQQSAGSVLLPAGGFGDAYTILEGIDLVDVSLSASNQAEVYIANPGSGQANVTLFQAFTYASSQGVFSWRGSVVLFRNLQLQWDAPVGLWSVTVWGHVEPAFTMLP